MTLEVLPAGLFGLLIGSFLNVCIYRWPRDMSVVKPRSHCPGCDAQIAAYDNIPLVSFLLLRGKCRHCGEPIGWRYPAVELLTGLSFAYFVSMLGFGPIAAKYCLFSAMLIGLVFADLETLILPDEFTIGGMYLGLGLSFLISVPDSSFQMLTTLAGWHWGPRWLSFGEAALGGFLPAGLLWLGGWLFERIRHKEGLGFGDVKMIAMVGAFLGLRGCLLTIVLGSVLGSAIGMAYIAITRKNASEYQLPFATFLGIGAFLAAIYGQNMIHWYEATMLDAR